MIAQIRAYGQMEGDPIESLYLVLVVIAVILAVAAWYNLRKP